MKCSGREVILCTNEYSPAEGAIAHVVVRAREFAAKVMVTDECREEGVSCIFSALIDPALKDRHM